MSIFEEEQQEPEDGQALIWRADIRRFVPTNIGEPGLEGGSFSSRFLPEQNYDGGAFDTEFGPGQYIDGDEF